MATLGRLLPNFFMLFFTSLATGSSEEYLLKPFPVQGAVGNSVIIYCQVNTAYTDRRVYWALLDNNNEVAIGPNINTNENFDRHQFVGNPLEGFYNLRISDITEHDEGNYSCIFHNNGSSPEDTFTLEAATFLSVTDTKRSTRVSCQDPGRLLFEDNSPLPDFSCTAEGGLPLADGQELNWYMQLRNNTLIKVPSVTSVDPSGPGSVTATINGDEFTLTGHNDNSLLLCSVGPLASSGSQFCDIPAGATGLVNDDLRIRVQYEPLVQFLPSSVEVGLFEQFELDLKCIADSNPALMGPPTLEFGDISRSNVIETGNDSFVEGRLFSRARLSVTRGDIGKEINCTATNFNGTTTISIKIESLGGLPAWLICAIIFAGGFLAFFILILCLCLCCQCDLEQEGKRRERRRRTFRDSKVNGVHALHDDDDFRDLDLSHGTFDNPSAMMPESPRDSGNYAYAESDDGSEGLVNDFKIEEPDGETHHVQITSDGEFDDDDDEDPPKRLDYTHVTIADDTAGEEMELDELSRDRSPSLNEL